MSFRRFPASETNNSIGINGQPIPDNSTSIAGNGPTGLLTPILVDASGQIKAVVTALPLPANAATASNQVLEISALGAINTTLGSPFQAGGSIGNTQFGASQVGTWNLNNISGIISLPTGASTSANQLTANASLASIDSKLTSPLSVTVGNFPATQPISGSVSVDNFPATQNISGSVSVTSLPSIPAGSNAIGSVSVSNFPATQPVSGTVSVGNFPATQAVSGSVSVSNFPATQNVAVVSSVEVEVSNDAGNPVPVSGTVTAQVKDSFGNSINSTSGALNVNISSGSVTATNPSVSATGSPIPAQATFVGGSDGTNLRALKVSSAGILTVDGSSFTQPISGSISVLNFPAVQAISGSITANIGTTNGLALDATVANVQGSSSGGTAATKSSLSGGIYNSSAPTLTNGQQASLQLDASGNLKVAGSITATNSANGNTGSAVPVQATQIGGSDGTNLRALSVDSTGKVNINNISGTVSLPTGASTESTLSGMSAKLPAALGQTTMAGSLSVTLASNQSAIKAVATNSKGQFVRNDYTVTGVTTAAYVQLVASTSADYSALEIFDSSGQTLKLAIGAAASEVDQFIIFPGGNGRIPFTIPSGSRISIRAVSAAATVGEIDINFYV